MDSLTRPEGSQPEDFLVTRRAAAGLLVAGYAVAALAAEAKPIVTPADGLIVETVTIPNGAAKPLPAYVARPVKPGRHPAVIVVNEIFGVHAYIKDVCRRLARAGYVAIAPDFFYRSGVDLTALASIDEILPFVRQAGEAQVDGDVKATTDWLKGRSFADGKRIGITGFCWGGAVTWRTAMENPDVRAGVAWYGQLKALTPRAAELKAPVLGLYGGQDKGIPVADVEAFRAALAKAGKSTSSISSIRRPNTASTPIIARATTRRRRPMPGRGCWPSSASTGFEASRPGAGRGPDRTQELDPGLRRSTISVELLLFAADH